MPPFSSLVICCLVNGFESCCCVCCCISKSLSDVTTIWALVVPPVIGVAGLFPYCDDEEAADEGGGETRPLKAFTSCGGPGVAGLCVEEPEQPSLLVIAAGALFSRLMIVELLAVAELLLLLLLLLLLSNLPVGVVALVPVPAPAAGEAPATGDATIGSAFPIGGVLLLAAAAAANNNTKEGGG